jgi:hypothetical protein
MHSRRRASGKGGFNVSAVSRGAEMMLENGSIRHETTVETTISWEAAVGTIGGGRGALTTCELNSRCKACPT